jgi:uncharacterized MAPEG superfamily protein
MVMSISFLCVLIAAILPYLWVGYAKFSTKGYNNHSPREYLEKQEGQAKRAYYAHLNSFEAFPAFAASVIIAHLAGAREEAISALAITFVTFRIIYGLCYIYDKASIRSLIWFAAFSCIIGLFLLALIK